MKWFVLIGVLGIAQQGAAQKFMIKNGDTLPYKDVMEVRGEDTVYLGCCNTFVLKNNKIINREVVCVRRGYWEIEFDSGSIAKGDYTNWGREDGTWKYYNQKGQLIKEIEYASMLQETYVLRKIEYKNGQEIIISEKTWFARFYMSNIVLIIIITMGAFVIRLPINLVIVNREYGRGPFYLIPFTKSFDTAMRYNITVTFTFWWSGLKPENKNLGRLSNLLSVIALIMFFGGLIGLGISGELS